MKKLGVLIFVFILFSLVFVSAEEPSLGGSEQDMKDLQEGIDVIPLDPETGGIDKDKLNDTSSKAEERIDEINAWLKENAPWLSVFLGMKPEISWVFTVNFLFILALIVYVRNILVFASFFSERIATIIALATSFLFILSKLTVKLAEFIVGLASIWWVQLIVVILFLIALAIGAWIGHYAHQIRENREKFIEKTDRELLHKIAESNKTIFRKH